jgi:hypothetical protein
MLIDRLFVCLPDCQIVIVIEPQIERLNVISSCAMQIF